MSDHPYWSYGPDNGQQLVDALAEGRRLRALELAAQTTGFALSDESAHDRTEAVLANADKIEAYLKGETEKVAQSPGVGLTDADLEYLRGRSRRLRKLEAAGVDNWEGYSRALEGSDGGE